MIPDKIITVVDTKVLIHRLRQFHEANDDFGFMLPEVMHDLVKDCQTQGAVTDEQYEDMQNPTTWKLKTIKVSSE